MKRNVLIGTLAFGILFLAVAGWTVNGVRWAFTLRAPRTLRPA